MTVQAVLKGTTKNAFSILQRNHVLFYFEIEEYIYFLWVPFGRLLWSVGLDDLSDLVVGVISSETQ